MTIPILSRVVRPDSCGVAKMPAARDPRVEQVVADIPSMPRVQGRSHPIRKIAARLCAMLACGLAGGECCIAATPREAGDVATATQELRDGAPAKAPVDVPPEATALDAYLLARRWLDDDTLPAEDAPDARIDLGSTAAVCVILRLDGRLVGAGEAAIAVGAGGDEPALLLRRALGRAVSKALADDTIDAVRKAMGDKSGARAALPVTARLALEVELAGPIRPLIGRTIADASRRLILGDEGVAVLRADAAHRAYPSRLLAADIAARPDRTIAGLLIEAGLPVKDLGQYAAEERVSLGRFATIRLRAATPEGVPERVERCGRLIELAELTPGRIEALAGQLAARLAGQVVAGERGAFLLGTLNPTKDLHDPLVAPPRDAALATLALARAARSTKLPEPIRSRARAQALALASPLVAAPAEPADAAFEFLLAIAVGELEQGELEQGELEQAELEQAEHRQEQPRRGAPERAALREACRARVDRLAPLPADGRPTPESAVLRALQAAAALSLDAAGGPERAQKIVAALATTYRGSEALLLDAALPLSLTLAHPRATDATRAELARMLGELSQLFRRMQINRTSDEFADLPADIDGGLMLPGATIGVPDSSSLPLAAALVIAEPWLDPAEAAARRSAGTRSVRFLAQHVADDPWLGGIRNPNAVRGLVRGSLVGDDCPPGAASAGLMLAVAAAELPRGATRPGDPVKPAGPAPQNDRAPAGVAPTPESVPEAVPEAAPESVPEAAKPDSRAP